MTYRVTKDFIDLAEHDGADVVGVVLDRYPAGDDEVARPRATDFAPGLAATIDVHRVGALADDASVPRGVRTRAHRMLLLWPTPED